MFRLLILPGDNNLENWIDKLISYVSPAAAYKRQAWRWASRSFYDNGGTGRLNSAWNPQAFNNAEYGVMTERKRLLARARDLERNSDIANAFIQAFIRGTVGAGYNLQMKITGKDGRIDDKLNNKAEADFKEWCKPQNCDLSGRFSFTQICRIIKRRKFVDGGIIIVRNDTNNGMIPLQLQIREITDLDDTQDTYYGVRSGNMVINGIEVDKYNRHVAYYFKTLDNFGMITGKPVRVKADRVIFDADLIRPTQINPVSGLSTSMGRIAQIESYIEAINMKERINACFSMFITKSLPTGGMGRGVNGVDTDSASGYGGQTITPGMIYEGQPGDDAKAIMSGNSSGQTEQIIQTMQGLTGAGIGLSYSAVSRDTSKGNFSSQRQSRLDDDQFFKVVIDDDMNTLNTIISWFIESEILSGRLPIPYNDFINNPSRFTASDWIPNGMPWVNPLQESKANQVGLDPLNPQITIASIARSQGTDENTLIAQRARETAMIYNELQKQLTPEQYNHYLGVIPNGNNTTV